eukprot:CAMPEP_0196587530 /NCGR_PEP_ID=MMETSP1081-20130531/57718_1 /TAXON_ID=36882 /ORGANISM="Pyramimonas amylifera, Strain CCMP720" /LENGTH=199 /DNA_ID=CAMNT_0041909727 /DNA_START=246 /DNA_END=842 /DNA_ORIENTATION=-
MEASNRSDAEGDKETSICQAIVPYVKAPEHGLHARSLSYTFPALEAQVVLQQRYGEEGAGVGGAQWPAGHVLADFISKRPTLGSSARPFEWRDKQVLELGAGLGLVAIVAAHLGARVAATDGVKGVLPLLRSNIQAAAVGASWTHPVSTHLLRWGQEEEESVLAFLRERLPPLSGPGSSSGVDVVLAADVVYGDKVQVW